MDGLEYRIGLAREAVAARDWTQALERWAAVAEQFPDQSAGLIGKADALAALGRHDEAEALLIEVVERFPTDQWGFVHYAMIASRRRDWHEAQRRWERVRVRFPDRPSGYVGIGEVLRESGRFEEADAALAQATARFPNERWAAIHYAQVAVSRQDWPEALNRWRLVHDRFPDALEGYTRLAEAWAELGGTDEADAILREGADKFASNPHTTRQLAETATRLQRWKVAAALWPAVREHSPDEPTAYANSAEALQQAGRMADADEVLDIGRRRFPGNEVIAMGAVRLALARGDRPRALRQWHTLMAFPERNNPRDRQRIELRKQLALSRPGFDPSSIDIAAWTPGTVISEDPVIILSDCPALEVVEYVALIGIGLSISLWACCGRSSGTLSDASYTARLSSASRVNTRPFGLRSSPTTRPNCLFCASSA